MDTKIDFSIDVRYEQDIIKAFNKFIEKWCGGNYPHLIDSDENDGQFMREKIEDSRNSVIDECIKVISELQHVYTEGYGYDMVFVLGVTNKIYPKRQSEFAMSEHGEYKSKGYNIALDDIITSLSNLKEK